MIEYLKEMKTQFPEGGEEYLAIDFILSHEAKMVEENERLKKVVERVTIKTVIKVLQCDDCPVQSGIPTYCRKYDGCPKYEEAETIVEEIKGGE